MLTSPAQISDSPRTSSTTCSSLAPNVTSSTSLTQLYGKMRQPPLTPLSTFLASSPASSLLAPISFPSTTSTPWASTSLHSQTTCYQPTAAPTPSSPSSILQTCIYGRRKGSRRRVILPMRTSRRAWAPKPCKWTLRSRVGYDGWMRCVGGRRVGLDRVLGGDEHQHCSWGHRQALEM